VSQQVTSIENESQYRSAVRQLDQDKRPPFLLRLLMNALEAYRQARKMGWSRPQNKYGLTVFESFRLDRGDDRPLIDLVLNTCLAEFPELDEDATQYVRALFEDPNLMGFIFVHDCRDEGKLYEGITFSFGRVAAGQSRHRDRFDLILESEVTGGTSQGLSRVRAYVDPFTLPIRKHPARAYSHEPVRATAAQDLFLSGADVYARWRDDADRAWQHWTQRYINYFGPRTSAVGDTYFPTLIDQVATAQPILRDAA